MIPYKHWIEIDTKIYITQAWRNANIKAEVGRDHFLENRLFFLQALLPATTFRITKLPVELENTVQQKDWSRRQWLASWKVFCRRTPGWLSLSHTYGLYWWYASQRIILWLDTKVVRQIWSSGQRLFLQLMFQLWRQAMRTKFAMLKLEQHSKNVTQQ